MENQICECDVPGYERPEDGHCSTCGYEMMDMPPKGIACDENKHEWNWSEPRESTGPNILGKEVTCMMQDGKCSVCGERRVRRVNT